jgi:hypothetical protein
MKPSQEHNPDEIDPRLFELLDQLRPTPARDPEAAARGRKKYLTELKNLKFEAPAPSQANSMPRWLRRLVHKHDINDNQREDLLMNKRTQRFTLTGALIVITLLVFLFGGAGMTALASQSSLPGDALYPVKTSLEQTRVALARSAADRAQLQMEFAERRLGEIAGLIEEGRFENIPTATAEFETYIRNALSELETIAKGDPEQAALLAGQVSEALTRYALTLTGMLDQVPESVRLEMRRTLQNTQAAGLTGEMEFSGVIESMAQQTWMIAGRTVGVNSATEVKGPFLVGDIVKVHAFQNADGSLTAREIERVRAGQANDNGNDNSNTNTNANENMNENGNANVNTNSNSNDGAVQNQNQNMNQNQNQNNNQNWNQNDNQNMNQNQNQNDNQNWNQNDNQNMNQNQNQNNNQNWNQNQNDNQNDNQNQNRNSNDNDDDD